MVKITNQGNVVGGEKPVIEFRCPDTRCGCEWSTDEYGYTMMIFSGKRSAMGIRLTCPYCGFEIIEVEEEEENEEGGMVDVLGEESPLQ